MTKPVPGDGQYFTLNPVPPPEPKATTHWGLPLALGLLAIPLLMFGFGFSQQQTPATTAASPTATPSVSPLPTPSLASQDATTQPPETSAAPLTAAIRGLATIRVKTSHLLETPMLQGFQVKQLMSFFYDTKTTASDGWTTFGLNDTQKAAFS